MSSNVAVTVVLELTVTAQASVPEQAPAHPENALFPAAGVAVSVTAVPSSKVAEHVPPSFEQVMPAGELVTEPAPSPDTATESVKVWGGVVGFELLSLPPQEAANVATTARESRRVILRIGRWGRGADRSASEDGRSQHCGPSLRKRQKILRE